VARRERAEKRTKTSLKPSDGPRPIAGLRIIGGRFRGRKLLYSGDARTRPMKDRLREAVFNLVGPSIRGKHVLDLFAGTGALGLEALSRGADRATLVEQHYPTAKIILQNIAVLELQQQAEVVVGNVFVRFQRGLALTDRPWAVFCSPPYDFYVSRTQDVLEMIAGLMQTAPPESVFIVEADQRFDFSRLPDPTAWDVRPYPPAVVGIYRRRG
jgi:16S rRNA (guanine966-N2)-methyltransferase